MFSSRSFGEKPRSLFKPRRSKCCSSAVAIVDFPEADRPVNQTVQPFCLRSSLRSWRVRPGCHVMLVAIVDIGVGLTGTCVWVVSLRITEFLLFQVARNLYQCTLIGSVPC